MLLAASCLALLPAGDLPLPPSQTGLLYVSGFSTNNVGEYAPDGTLLRTLSAPGMQQPRGIAVDDAGNLVVVSQASDRIQVIDLNGDLLQEIVHPDLTSGTGIARSADGRWYVGNFAPGRILVFDAQWSHQATITDPDLNGVNCVSFDPDGSITVTDAANHRLMRFDAQHNVIGFADHGSLFSPMSIAMDSHGDHYVSNGSSGVVTKFDASWNYLMTFGGGTLSAPQGIGIDEHDVLTISNFSASTVHRYDVDGNLLGSFPLVGVAVGRNLAWQTSPFALASQGASVDASGNPLRVLRANGSSGDALGHITLGAGAPLQLSLDLVQGWPSQVGAVLYGQFTLPTVGDVTTLPGDMGLFSFAPPFAGGSSAVLINSHGREALLGAGLRSPAPGAGALLAIPGGLPASTTLTLQALVEDPDAPGGALRASNTLVIQVQ